jgi:hypothetical protein
MTKHFVGSWAILSTVAGTLAMTGCAHNLATIHYKQPANAYIFDSDPTGSPHETTSAGDGIFAFYCIETIENNDTNAQDFKFDASKVFVPQDPTNVAGNTSFNYKVQTAPSTLTVPAHTTSASLGRIVINVNGAGDPKSLKTQLLNLSYKSASGESVLLVRDGGASPPAAQFLDPASPVNPNNLPACP